MPRTTVRTAQPYDFNEMNPGQFEDLVRQLLGNLDGVEWVVRPVAVGRLGADEGKDILLRERVRGRRGRMGERTWLVQVKRYKEIGPRQLVRIVDRQSPPDPHRPTTSLPRLPAGRPLGPSGSLRTRPMREE